MKRAYLLVISVTFVFVSALQAGIQMDFLGGDGNGNDAYAITGSDHGSFELYLQCFSPAFSVWREDGGMQVTDLGITHEQNHLFEIRGYDGSPFFISPAKAFVVVEVFDMSMSRIGVYTNYIDPHFRADAGGPYTIAAGESVAFDSSRSYLVMEREWNPASSLQVPEYVGVREWKIDGKSVGALVSFDDLVGTLGLSYGVHILQMDATAFDEEGYAWDGSAFSTIEIIPEPGSLVLLGLGVLVLRRRRR